MTAFITQVSGRDDSGPLAVGVTGGQNRVDVAANANILYVAGLPQDAEDGCRSGQKNSNASQQHPDRQIFEERGNRQAETVVNKRVHQIPAAGGGYISLSIDQR